jgi:flagellar biogenesis protein FliO
MSRSLLPALILVQVFMICPIANAQDELRSPSVPHGAAADSLPKLPPPKPIPEASRTSSLTNRSPRWIATRACAGLGVFLALILVQRLFVPGKPTAISRDAIEVCGKVPFDAKRTLHLVRVGSRLLVLLESPQGMQRLAEITDPEEVQQLLSPGRVHHTWQERQLHSTVDEIQPVSVSQVLAQFRDVPREVRAA